MTDSGRRRLLIAMVGETRRAVLERAGRAIDHALFAIDATRGDLQTLAGRIDYEERRRSDAVEVIDDGTGRIPDLERLVSEERRLARVVGTDFPYVALEAYVSAAADANRDDPACALHWTTLAGIGRIESRHGTYAGGALDRDGNTSVAVIGIPLTGEVGTLVLDSDGGELDGDAEFDRAIGPMQFIPSTWRRWGRDGNDDGVVDPHNLYDAARSAAAYLCVRVGLDAEENLREALYSYNHSVPYVEAVLAYAGSYSHVAVS